MAPCKVAYWQSGAFAAVIRCAKVGLTPYLPNSLLNHSCKPPLQAVNTMDHKRNLLLAALAVVSYLLLLAWNNDFPAQVATAGAQLATTAESGSLDLPVTTAGTTSDIPAAPGQVVAVDPVSPQSRIITVRTPNQVAQIDLLGGDIISLSLPRYPKALETPNDPFQLLRNDVLETYVAQSGLVGRNGPDGNSNGRPLYKSAQTTYTTDSGELTVDIVTATSNGVAITKRFIFNSDDYLIRQQYLINNNSTAEWRGNVFGQLKRNNGTDPSSSTGMKLNNFLGAAMTSPDDPYMKLDFGDIDDGEEPVAMAGGWIAFSQHYFLGAWIPPAEEQNTYSVRRNESGEYLMGYVGQEFAVAPGAALTLESALWAGPKNQDRLEELAKNLGLTIDYGMLWFVGYPIFQLLSWINSLVGNYGVAIILLTVIIRTLFYPLSAKQFASQAGMKRLQPKMNQLKERYGDDKQKLMQAQMELWKKEKVSPFSGCLPMFLQMPVFLGIYWVLNESVELRQAPFFLWYQDLSALDPFFILPILLGGAYYLQQHMNPMPTTDPMQAKMMKFMPVIFSVFFLWFPAGLVLYYLANALLGILQQWYFNQRLQTVPANDG